MMSTLHLGTSCPEPLQQPYVFISYSWVNKDIARRIRGELKGIVNVWLDIEQLQVGGNNLQRMGDGLMNCEKVLIFYSPAYTTSNFAQRELYMATALGKKIIPIKVSSTFKDPLWLRSKDVTPKLDLSRMSTEEIVSRIYCEMHRDEVHRKLSPIYRLRRYSTKIIGAHEPAINQGKKFVYISYASEDEAAYSTLKKHLDVEKVPAEGSQGARASEGKTITDSAIVVLLLSTHFCENDFNKKDAWLAATEKKPLFPLIVEAGFTKKILGEPKYPWLNYTISGLLWRDVTVNEDDQLKEMAGLLSCDISRIELNELAHQSPIKRRIMGKRVINKKLTKRQPSKELEDADIISVRDAIEENSETLLQSQLLLHILQGNCDEVAWLIRVGKMSLPDMIGEDDILEIVRKRGDTKMVSLLTDARDA